MTDSPPVQPADSLAAACRVTATGPSSFAGHAPAGHLDRGSLFGGLVAAQALHAAGHTVPADRFPHSLHCYFLRPGDVNQPIEHRVDVLRDGRSFSARMVVVTQADRPILSMLCSFHSSEPGPFLDRMPTVNPMPQLVPGPSSWSDPLLEILDVTTSRVEAGRKYLFPDRLWVRSATALPDDPLAHACALTYMSDLGSGFGQDEHPELGSGGPTVDHAVWFGPPVRADEWLLVDLRPAKSNDYLALYTGAIRTQSGELAAVLSQEGLNRPLPLPGTPEWPMDLLPVDPPS